MRALLLSQAAASQYIAYNNGMGRGRNIRGKKEGSVPLDLQD
jgi:hypothetical protein